MLGNQSKNNNFTIDVIIEINTIMNKNCCIDLNTKLKKDKCIYDNCKYEQIKYKNNQKLTNSLTCLYLDYCKSFWRSFSFS